MFFPLVIDLQTRAFDHVIQPGVRPLRQRRLLHHHAQIVSKGSRPGAHTVILQMDINFLKDIAPHGYSPSTSARAA